MYYRSNNLRANPDKTQVTAFHLKNREAKRKLEVEWNITDLENTPNPKYLGVSLDRTLGYKQHIHNTKMKVATRNNLLKKLSNSKWGCNASTIRKTALALSYSAAEFACPVWTRSPHASKLDPELNIIIILLFHSSVHCFPTSFNIIRSSKEQECASWEHCNMYAVVSSAFPQAHVVFPV